VRFEERESMAYNTNADVLGSYTHTVNGPKDFTVNKNKLVEITACRKNTSGGDITWRENLSSILGTSELNSTSKSYLTKTQSLINALNARSDVALCLESAPSLKFEVGTTEGFSNLINSLVSSFGGNIKTKSSSDSSKMNAADWVMFGVNAISSASSAAQGGSNTSGTFNPWFLDTSTWADSTKPFEFTMNFKFKMGQYRLWSAKEEVVKPLLNLIAPVMNQQLGSLFTKGPFPSCLDLIGKCINGASSSGSGSFNDYWEGENQWSEIWGNSGDDSESWLTNLLTKVSQSVDFMGNIFQAFVLSGYKNYTYDVKIGSFITFKKVIYKSCEISWGTETDQEGFPTTGSATVNFLSILPPALSSRNTNTMFANFNI
jgi:hypothetical protein